MTASLDTNVLLHLYRSGNQSMLFELFDDDIYIDEFIYGVELKHHGQDIIPMLLKDIAENKITIVTKEMLKEWGILPLYKQYLEEERKIYFSSDMGEIHAIALARCIGAFSVVTDDTKVFGPHYALMRIPDSDIIPLTFYEVLILLYLKGVYTANQAIDIFHTVIDFSPELPYEFKSKISFFIKRFIGDPYTPREAQWFQSFCQKENIAFKKKFKIIVDKLATSIKTAK